LVKVFSMFSGIGGFELGIQQSTMDAELVGYSEINKYAIQIFEERIKGVKNYGDATNIMGDELPEFELLCAGFPCQAFSVAGKRRGFDDTRGTLFFDIARICSEKRPRHLVLENVKGLLSHESGQTFHTILKVLSDMGYDVEWQVLNSKDFGVPQSRERVYIVGHFGNRSPRKVFPITGNVRETSIITGKDISYSLDANYYKGTNLKGYLTKKRRQLVFTAMTRDTDQDVHWRKLTPLECERLQTVDDNYTEGVSNTQRYKMLGNGWTIDVISHILNHIK